LCCLCLHQSMHRMAQQCKCLQAFCEPDSGQDKPGLYLIILHTNNERGLYYPTSTHSFRWQHATFSSAVMTLNCCFLIGLYVAG
jgi:hypothetical protein